MIAIAVALESGEPLSLFIGNPITLQATDASWYFTSPANTSVPAAALYPRVPVYDTVVNFTTYHLLSPYGVGSIEREIALSKFTGSYIQFIASYAFGVNTDATLALDLCKYGAGQQSFNFFYTVSTETLPGCSDSCGFLGGKSGYSTSGGTLYCFYHVTSSHGSVDCTGETVEYSSLFGNNSAIVDLYKSQIQESLIIADIARPLTGYVYHPFDPTVLPWFNDTSAPQRQYIWYSSHSGIFGETGHNCGIDTGYFGLESQKTIEQYPGGITTAKYTIPINFQPVESSYLSPAPDIGYFTAGAVGNAELYTFGDLHSTGYVVPKETTLCQFGIQGGGCADAGTLSVVPTLFQESDLPACTPDTVEVTMLNRTVQAVICRLSDSETGVTSDYAQVNWGVSVPFYSDGTEVLRAIQSVSGSWSESDVYDIAESQFAKFCDQNANVSTNCAAGSSQYVYAPLSLCLKSGVGITAPGTIGLGSCSSDAVVAVTANEPEIAAIDETGDPYQYWSFGNLLVGFQLCGQTGRAITFTDPCSPIATGNLKASLKTPTANITNNAYVMVSGKVGGIPQTVTGLFAYQDYTRNTTYVVSGGQMVAVENATQAGLAGYYTLPQIISRRVSSPTSSYYVTTCESNGVSRPCNITYASSAVMPSSVGTTTVLVSNGYAFTMQDNGTVAVFTDEATGTVATVPMMDGIVGDPSPYPALSTVDELLGDLVATSNTIAFGSTQGLLDVAGALQNLQSEYLLGQAQDLANSDTQLAMIYENQADIANLQVLVQYIELVMVTQLGVNASTLVTPSGQPLNGSVSNCTAGTAGVFGVNVTFATCYNSQGDGTLYDVGFTTDCVPYGLPYTGGQPPGSTSLGECVYDAQSTSNSLENTIAGLALAQEAASAVNGSIWGVINLANQLRNVNGQQFGTLAGVYSDLQGQLSDLAHGLALAQNGSYANSFSIGSIGSQFSGWLGLSNLGHGIAEVIMFVVIILAVVLAVSIGRKLWYQAQESLANKVIAEMTAKLSQSFVLRTEIQRTQT